MSEKFNTFITELDDLCKKHDVTVTSSMYDQPAVWDGYDVGDIGVILDMTSGEKSQSVAANKNESG